MQDLLNVPHAFAVLGRCLPQIFTTRFSARSLPISPLFPVIPRSDFGPGALPRLAEPDAARAGPWGVREMDALLAWISARQNPAVCPSRLLHARPYGAGLGAQFVLIAGQMMHVLQSGGVYEIADTPTVYANPRVCLNKSFGCYVQRLTSCPPRSTDTHSSKHVTCVSFNASFWGAVGRSLSPPARRGSGVEFYLGGIMQYILRPSRLLHRRIAIARNRSRIGEDAACVAVHARVGDTKADRSRLPNPPHLARAYAALARQAAYNGQLDSFFVNSDSPTMVREISTELAPWGPVHTMPIQMFSMYKQAAAGHEVAIAVGQKQRATQLRANQDENEPDEGAALLAQLLISARCPAYVGSVASNLNRLVSGFRIGRWDHPIVDIDGQAWFACGTPGHEVHEGGPAKLPTEFIPWNRSEYVESLRKSPCKWTRTQACA